MLLWALVLVGVQVNQLLTTATGDPGLERYCLVPRTLHGLWGILASPFLHDTRHGSWDHLLGNLLPLVFGGLCVLVFYERVALRVFGGLVVLPNVLVWVMARPSCHMGASGVVYGLVGFLVVSGLVRSNRASLAVAAVTILMNQGIIWGMTPGQAHVSWESHAAGFLVGGLLAAMYRRSPLNPALFPPEEATSLDSDEDSPHDPNAPTPPGAWDYRSRVRL
jgi:membrane associated rhomboid family serine protease